MANWTIEQIGSFWLGSDNQDMSAIRKRVDDIIPITSEAVRLKDDFIVWWNNLSFFEQNVETSTFDEARNRLHAIEIANQPTPEAKEEIRKIIARGITTEEMEGEAKRALSTGDFPAPPPAPLISPVIKTSLIVAVIAGVGLGIASIVSKLNPASLILGLVKKKGEQ